MKKKTGTTSASSSSVDFVCCTKLSRHAHCGLSESCTTVISQMFLSWCKVLSLIVSVKPAKVDVYLHKHAVPHKDVKFNEFYRF